MRLNKAKMRIVTFKNASCGYRPKIPCPRVFSVKMRVGKNLLRNLGFFEDFIMGLYRFFHRPQKVIQILADILMEESHIF